MSIWFVVNSNWYYIYQHHYFNFSPLSNKVTNMCSLLSSKCTEAHLAVQLCPDAMGKLTVLPKMPQLN